MQKIILFTLLLIATTISYAQNPCIGVATVTYLGKTYNTIQIGNQCWLNKNLDIGIMIHGDEYASNNGQIEKYCYDDDQSQCTIYGALYNEEEAMQYVKTPRAKGICPEGWHIPDYREFLELKNYLNWNGNSLKAEGQGKGAGAGTNTTGFSALLGGHRDMYFNNTYFFNLHVHTYFWSSDGSDMNLNSYNSDIGIGAIVPINPVGFSVRCIKDESGTATEKDNKKGLPIKYSLSQNYPNPFNPTTTINYSIPKSSFISIKIYDELGKEVATLVDGNKSVGNYSIEFDTNKLSSGIYYYRMQSDKFSETKKFILIK